jgi:hypothetical protein
VSCRRESVNTIAGSCDDENTPIGDSTVAHLLPMMLLIGKKNSGKTQNYSNLRENEHQGRNINSSIIL